MSQRIRVEAALEQPIWDYYRDHPEHRFTSVQRMTEATRNGHRVYAVVMHSDDIEADPTALLNWAWRELSWN